MLIISEEQRQARLAALSLSGSVGSHSGTSQRRYRNDCSSDRESVCLEEGKDSTLQH